MNKHTANIIMSLMTVCIVFVGLWVIQASSANTTGTDNPQFQGAGSMHPGTGSAVQPGMTVPSKATDEGGIYCSRVCVSMPDLWDMSCVPECFDLRG